MQTETYRYVTISSLPGEYKVIRRSDGKDLGMVLRDPAFGRDAWRALTPGTPLSQWYIQGVLCTRRGGAAVLLDALDRAKGLTFAVGGWIEYRTAMWGRMRAVILDVSLDGQTFAVNHPSQGQMNINIEDVARAMESRDGLPVYAPQS